MNGLGKCMKIPHVVKLQQIARKWRKLASARKAARALACNLLSSRSGRVSYVSDDEGNMSKDGHRRLGSASAVPPDVPAGHLAVYVGQQCSKRFVIRAAYLNHPVFRLLLQQTEEEFGYAHQGALAIPCDEVLFEHILGLFSGNDHATVRHLDLEAVKINFCNEWNCSSESKGILLDSESRPLLHAFAWKSFG